MKNLYGILIVLSIFAFYPIKGTAAAVSKADKNILAKIIPAVKPVLEAPEINNSGNWDIGLGSFSNYTKAKNHALEIQKQNPRETGKKSIEISIEQIEAAIVYNPRITGFSKENADNFCNRLKKSNKSCMVIKHEQLYLAYYRE